MASDKVLQVRASVRRWKDLAAYAVVGGALAALAAPTVVEWLQSTSGRSSVSSWMLVPLIAVATILAAYHGWGRVTAFSGVRHLWRFPPVWISGLFGSVVAVAILGLVPGAWATPAFPRQNILVVLGVLTTASGLLTLVVLAQILIGLRRGTPPLTADADEDPPQGAALDFGELCEWVKDDRPVTAPHLDRFGHTETAARILGRLSAGDAASVALLGPLGSGKTTIRALVEQLAAVSQRNLRVVSISLWPYANAEAAVRGILQALIGAFRSEVNVLPLMGIPEAYIDAVSGGPAWTKLARLLGSSAEPSHVLDRLGQVTAAIGIRFVVWIEDFERFAGWGDQERDEPEDLERVGALRALLHLLDEQPWLSVVVASTHLGARFDAQKIARYVEHTPGITYADAWETLKTFRSGCFRMLGENVDPAHPTARAELDFGDETLNAALGLPDGHVDQPVGAALVTLCTTPRALKQALRRAFSAWTALLGEIDPDDLLVLSVLREAEPDAFSLFEEYRMDLQMEVAGLAHSRASAFRHRIDQLAMPADRYAAIERLVQYLVGTTGRGAPRRPQGVGGFAGRDYFRRLLTEHVSPRELDQPVLRKLSSFHPGIVAELFADKNLRGIALRFERLLSFEQVRQVLRTIVAQRLHERAFDWPRYAPPGLNEIHRIYAMRSRDGENDSELLAQELEDLVVACVPHNLALAEALTHRFAARTQPARVLNDDSDIKLQNTFAESFQQAFADSPAALIAALSNGPEFLLARCVWGIDRIRGGALATAPFPEWPAFAATILAAATLAPACVLPQVAYLVTTSDAIDPDLELRDRFRFSQAQAEALFPGDEVLELLCHHTLTSYHHANTRARYEAARRGAIALLQAPTEGGDERSDVVMTPDSSRDVRATPNTSKT